MASGDDLLASSSRVRELIGSGGWEEAGELLIPPVLRVLRALYLPEDVRAAPDQRLADAMQLVAHHAEPAVTRLVTEAVKQAGGELARVETRIKSTVSALPVLARKRCHALTSMVLPHPQRSVYRRQTSLLRKIHALADQEVQRSLTSGIDARRRVCEERVFRRNVEGGEDDQAPLRSVIFDSLRYTAVFPANQYTAGVTALRATLTASSELVREANFWLERMQTYPGINQNLALPLPGSTIVKCGRAFFEVQIHTPDSLAFCMEAHEQYERFRTVTEPDEKLQLLQGLYDKAQAVPAPVGVNTLRGRQDTADSNQSQSQSQSAQLMQASTSHDSDSV